MLEQFPFAARVILLLSLMAVISAVDLRRNGPKATRHKEYAFIITTGLLGGIIGFGNDLLTSSISPDYFTMGKGLPPGEGLQWAAGLYGLRTGFSAGIIGGALCMFCAGKGVPYALYYRLLWLPTAGALAVGLLFPVIASRFDPAGLAASLKEVLNPEQSQKFLTVWRIHSGLYLGLAAGLIALIVVLRKQRVLPISR